VLESTVEQLADTLDERMDFLRHSRKVHEKLEVQSFWPMTNLVNDDRAALSVIINVRDKAANRSASYIRGLLPPLPPKPHPRLPAPSWTPWTPLANSRAEAAPL